MSKLIKELEIGLAISDRDSIPYPENSIMKCGILCDHDDSFLCEHRLKWILDKINENDIGRND